MTGMVYCSRIFGNVLKKGWEMRALLAMLLVSVALTGCGAGDEAEVTETPDAESGERVEVVEDDAPIVAGTWEVIEVTRGEDISNTGTVYSFGRDGSMTTSSGMMSIEGTYTVLGDTLAMNLGGIEMNSLISFEGDLLVFEILNGDQIFLMERR